MPVRQDSQTLYQVSMTLTIALVPDPARLPVDPQLRGPLATPLLGIVDEPLGLVDPATIYEFHSLSSLSLISGLCR